MLQDIYIYQIHYIMNIQFFNNFDIRPTNLFIKVLFLNMTPLPIF